MKKLFSLSVLATILILSATSFQEAHAVTVTHNLESCANGSLFSVQGEIGTAGTLGTDYALGTFVTGGSLLGHGFPNAYNWAGGFVLPAPPSGTTDVGAMEATDHNWLQGVSGDGIVVDLGAGNEADQAIVFNSIDHLGGVGSCVTPAELLWDAMVEGIEFTVYGSNDLADISACAGTTIVGAGGASEAGVVPGAGTCSTLEKGTLDYVFNDGWQDFGNMQEGDDFASVWQFSQQYRYIMVYSGFTDPFVGDGFRSDDNELDAIGRFLKNVGEPCVNCQVIGGEIIPIDSAALLIAGAQTSAFWMAPLLFVAAGTIVFIKKKF